MQGSVPLEAFQMGRAYAWSAYQAVRERGMYDRADVYCSFVGYPRSGHSLVAWLLEAHPETVIAPELDAVKYVHARFRRGQIFALLRRRAVEIRKAREEQPTGYSYAVPGQWQGRFREIRVIGDKKGGGTSMRLSARPWLLDRMRTVFDRRLAFVHVCRNPFDNIATMSRRSGWTLAEAADRYFTMAGSVHDLQQRIPAADWFETSHEDVIADPRGVLAALCGFLGIEATEEYLDACAAIVYASPSASRHRVEWPGAVREDVARRAAGFPFLADYRFDDVDV